MESVHEDRVLELLLVEAMPNLDRELEAVGIHAERRDPQRSLRTEPEEH